MDNEAVVAEICCCACAAASERVVANSSSACKKSHVKSWERIKIEATSSAEGRYHLTEKEGHLSAVTQTKACSRGHIRQGEGGHAPVVPLASMVQRQGRIDVPGLRR